MEPSDKITSGYWGRYLERFERFEPFTILELGVLDGASLDLWHERFPQAKVAGIDRNPPSDLGSDAPWRTYFCEQDDVEMLASLSRTWGGWDLIVDDCEHVGEKTSAAFNALWPHLRSGGWYVIEDWCTGYWQDWPDYGSGHTMVDFAKSLVDYLPGAGSAGVFEISSVEFVPGQVFVRKG